MDQVEKLRERLLVRGRELVLVQVLRVHPAVPRVIVNAAVRNRALLDRAAIDREVDLVGGVDVVHLDRALADLDLEAQLFGDLAGEGLRVALAVLDAAAGKFPEQRQRSARAALRDQVAAIFFEHGGDNADAMGHSFFNIQPKRLVARAKKPLMEKRVNLSALIALFAVVLAAPIAAQAGPSTQKNSGGREPSLRVVQSKPRLCTGDYADALPPEIASRSLDEEQKAQFIFAIRSIATYEHIYYGRDGKLRKQYLRAVAHGTGFGWKVLNGETYLVTNEHVASRPDVTDEDHPVEGIPPGSKKVREQLKIVKDEGDDYEPGHIPLTKVMSDPTADIAVLKSKKLLPVLPFRVGKSNELRAGNVVQVRGFPLGVFTALSSGKVVNPNAPDTEKGWMHNDFVVDALLSAGNSGSPVFAVSCRTGEPELVGVFHAGYADAAALNVVVAIDQLREELETFKVPKRDPAGLGTDLTAADRDRMIRALAADPSHSIVIPFAGHAVRVKLVDAETLRFSILSDDYPLSVEETLAVIDRSTSGFGTLGDVGLPINGQVIDVRSSGLDPESRDHFEKLQAALWSQLVAVTDYRVLAAKSRLSADAFSSAQDIASRIKRRANDQKDMLGLCAYDADQSGVPAQRPDGGAVVPIPSAPQTQPAGPLPVASPTSPANPANPLQTTPAAAPSNPGGSEQRITSDDPGPRTSAEKPIAGAEAEK